MASLAESIEIAGRRTERAGIGASSEDSREIKIGFVHRTDPWDVRSWSGIPYFMCRSLEKHVGQVVALGPDLTRSTKILFGTLWRINKAARPILGRTFIGEANRITSIRLGSFFRQRIDESEVDVLFAPVASTEIAYLKTSKPIVYLSDATWKIMAGYYPGFSCFSTLGAYEVGHIESRAIQRASAIVYPSEWAASSARDHYHVREDKLSCISFGANLLEVPDREQALAHRPISPLQLLWVGVDWRRKGADVAVSCLDELLKAGIDARLTICGCAPPEGFDHPRVKIAGFLNKRDPEQRKRLSRLFLDAHFFIFPTRAEAFGVVVAEASAHGLPTLGANTGGVPGVLRDGENGRLLPPASDGRAYAEMIRAVLADPDEYPKLVRGSRDLYERELNWDAWGKAMRKVFSTVLAKHQKKGAINRAG